ncbi:SMI1/KNR4 family protein [Kitasatospora phosalacinea]|uniref:SMI1/KNR4 family protein n=1 Tax=Kitasatospora phosalacinea TaxID=2065 RepID=UPI0035DDBACD
MDDTNDDADSGTDDGADDGMDGGAGGDTDGELVRRYRGRMVTGPFPAFDEAESAALERETGRPLPEPYLAFLRAAGGSGLDYSVHLPECEPEPLHAFDELYVLGRDATGRYGPGTLLGEYRSSTEPEFRDLLPIARSGGGDTLFLDLAPATHGRLCAFVSGIPWPGRLQHGVFTEVAPDFDAYLDALVLDPDVAELHWEDVSGHDPADPWRRAVEARLDRELPHWRAEPWAPGQTG